jgi:hypothetical protein
VRNVFFFGRTVRFEICPFTLFLAQKVPHIFENFGDYCVSWKSAYLYPKGLFGNFRLFHAVRDTFRLFMAI